MWDALVIGAGPAGAVSAYQLAKRGWRVLLVEKSAWPRDKPCGGCLSASAIDCLREIGLSQATAGAQHIARTVIHVEAQQAELPMQRALAISRRAFDEALVNAFIDLGGSFLPGAAADLLPDSGHEHRAAEIRVGPSESCRVRARVVLACDGLAGSSVKDEPWARWTIEQDSRIGIALCVDANALPIESGSIHLHLAGGGYVGAVRYRDNQVHLAAALDPSSIRKQGGAATAVSSILLACGRSVDARSLKPKGVPTLTRRRGSLGGHRVLAVGDACGYVEPFTGEGIAWALRSAVEVTTLLSKDWNDRLPQRWTESHRRTLGTSQAFCRAVRFVTRRPLLASATVGMLRAAPSLARVVTEAR